MDEEILMARFDAPRVIRYGGGTRRELAEELERLGSRRPLVVTDAWVRKSGSLPLLENARIFDGVQADPTDLNVEAGIQRFDEHDADGIVAIGGGSPIDCAKAIRFARKPAPLVAVPTTAGTGSEATPVMVITDTRANVKRMTKLPELMPDAAIVDFELTLSMPRPLTAAVGVDTLTHGMEAFVSRKATALTNPLAESTIRLTARYLHRAWSDGEDRAAREAMSLAALQGGMAFGNASVALVHGMSRPLGAVFHLPHGLSNAVLLPAVTRFSWQGSPEAYGRIASFMQLPESREGFVEALENLNRDLELPSLRECCGGRELEFRQALPKMAADALASGSPANNPVVPTEEEIVALYLDAWGLSS